MKLSTSDDLLICNACGAQYEVTSSSNKSECRICDVSASKNASLYLALPYFMSQAKLLSISDTPLWLGS